MWAAMAEPGCEPPARSCFLFARWREVFDPIDSESESTERGEPGEGGARAPLPARRAWVEGLRGALALGARDEAGVAPP